MAEEHLYKETAYDFFLEEKWTTLIAGYRRFKKDEPGFIPYNIYRSLLFPFQAFFLAMCFIAAVISFGNTVDTIHAIHGCLLVLVSFCNLSLRLVTGNVLIETFQAFRTGVYFYNEGKFDDEHETTKKKYVIKIRNMNRMFKKLVALGAISNVILVPLIQFVMVKESSGQRTLNPYLPQTVYMPFNTRTLVGYSAAFIINIMYFVMVVKIVTCIYCIFSGCTLQMKAQFEILNYSLRNIEKRAYAYIKNNYFTISKCYDKNSFSTSEFQDSMYKCLRSNIKHHQALLRLKQMFETCFQFIFLTIFGLSSVVLAAHVLLILEIPEAVILVNFLLTLLCETFYTLHCCWCGEELISESGEVYYSLYFTPWYNCDSRFKKLLSIMISNTRNPVHIKTFGFDVTASLHSFGSVISIMYQVVNLIRKT